MLVLENGNYVEKNEADFPKMPAVEIPYEEKVVALIREKYSLDEELAIQRQRDVKSEEFQVYFEYCEECKQKAKSLT